MELLECDLPRIKIRVECSKGTYIRSLAREIGEALASGGYLASLRRTRSGGHCVENALELNNIINILSPAKHF
jgi:tRNA pseudouridine55 synthase